MTDQTDRSPLSNRMRVWYVTMGFPVASETFATTEVAALGRLGVEVEVHTFRPPPDAASSMLAARGLTGLVVRHGSLRRQLGGLWQCLWRPLATCGLIRFVLRQTWRRPRHLFVSCLLVPRAVGLFAEVERATPDVVHLYWGHFPALVGYLVQRYLGACTAADDRPVDCRPASPGERRVALSTSLSAYDLTMRYAPAAAVARGAALVRTWAAANVADIQALGVSRPRIAVIYQGIDLALTPLVTPDAKVRGRVVTCGRLIADKATDDVLRVFRAASDAVPGASLVVLGDGPQRAKLEQLAAELGIGEGVTFRGHVAHDAVFAELAQAEVFLFLSRHPSERLPNVVKEAMACRAICITSETDGIVELLRDGEHGFIVPPGDLEQATQRLRVVLAGVESYATLLAASEMLVRERFDVERTARQLVDLWDKIVGSGRAPSGTSSQDGDVD